MANYGIDKIEFISAGFKEILQSEGCQEVVQEVTDQIANNARSLTDEVESTVVIAGHGQGRYIGLVSVPEAAESEDKVLSRSIS